MKRIKSATHVSRPLWGVKFLPEFRIVGDIAMKEYPQLGLVCLTTSDAVRYRTMTRKRLLQLAEVEQKSAVRQLYAENLSRLERREPRL